jgi:hypothetical protein
MFGSTKNLPQPSPKLAGLDPARQPTHEQARPLPYFCGTRKLGTTFISGEYNVSAQEITARTGKSSSGVVGYRYFGNWMSLICLGPVDRWTRWWRDGNLLWEGTANRSSESHEGFIGIAIARLFWGTETQEIFSDHEVFLGETYSAFRGACYVAHHDSLGENQPRVPAHEFELGRFPQPPWLTVPAEIDGDVNPVVPFWEWYTNKRFGAGLDESLLDHDSLNAAAARLQDEGLALSPLVTRETPLPRLIAELLEYIDGYPTETGGKLGIGLIRPITVPVPAITDDDVVDDPDLKIQTWDDTKNLTRVTFDRRDDWVDDAAKFHDRANQQITGKFLSQTLNRPWVTRMEVADKIASAAGRSAGVPQASGSMTVLRSAGDDLREGTVVDVQLSRRAFSIRARIRSWSRPSPDRETTRIEFEEDRGWANGQYYLPEVEPPLEEIPLELDPLFDSAILDAPFALMAPDRHSMFALAARGNRVTSGLNIWFSGNDETFDYSPWWNDPTGFAIAADIETEYPAETMLVDDAVRLHFTLSGPDNILDADLDLSDALANKFLAFIGGEIGGEILSLYDIDVIAPGEYRASVIRARYDTRRRTHSVASRIWIIARQRIPVHSETPHTADRWYKLQPTIGPAELPLAEIDSIERQYSNRHYRPLPPANLAANGDGHAPVWEPGQDVEITWTNTARERTVDGALIQETFPLWATHVKIEITRESDSETVATITPLAVDAAVTLPNANLLAWLGSATPFLIRARSDRYGFESFDAVALRISVP